MGEPEQQKTLTLAEQWSLQDSGEELDHNVTTEKVKPADASPEEVVQEKADENPVVADSVTQEISSENAAEIPAADESTLVTEENSDAPDEEVALVEEEAEEKPEIKLETAPADFRFPTTNQTRHCFTRYVEYHKCIAAKGEGAPECEKFAKYYRSLCPSEWVERWNEQRENGTFPGPL